MTETLKDFENTERECLAIIWAVKILDSYLQGSRFSIRTDNETVRWILNMTEAKGKLRRWILRLASFDYDVVHRYGVKHQAADDLARLEATKSDTKPIDNYIPLLFIADSTQDH